MSIGKWQCRLAALAAAIMGLSTSAWAQHGYMSAPILNHKQAHSLDQAILVIAIPPLTMFIGILYYLYRRRAGSGNT